MQAKTVGLITGGFFLLFAYNKKRAADGKSGARQCAFGANFYFSWSDCDS